MSESNTSRRDFVSALAGVGAAWIVSDWMAVESALAHATQAVAQQPPPAFAVLSADEAADIEAMAERIMPSDETPGAKEAGVIYFIDRSLQTFNKDQVPFARAGLKDLNKRAAKRKAGARFSQLGTAEQDALLKEIENTPFFGGTRFLTIVGMFANPSYGGNRDSTGWKLIGFEPHAAHKPPFGYYDAQAAKGAAKA
ncbi:MAG TPA: gluconate 2-dehydrogenase subunit 3 family protein [Gemmatimonadaceae bacterium]|nr:gluconate 2-dehydrogenase subunit 3 family protein [Gemmatimonadaceae bacterium]